MNAIHEKKEFQYEDCVKAEGVDAVELGINGIILQVQEN